MAGQIGIGYGTTIECEDGVSSDFQEWDEPKSINLPDISAPMVEATPLNGTSGYRRKKPGLLEFGAMTFEVYYTIETYIRALNIKRQNIGWRVTDPDNGTIVFDGALSKASVAFNVDDMMVIQIEVIVYDGYQAAVAV